MRTRSYNDARILKEKQDTFCDKVNADKWDGLGEFPDDLKLEALVDVLRGRVKVLHVYFAVNMVVMLRCLVRYTYTAMKPSTLMTS